MIWKTWIFHDFSHLDLRLRWNISCNLQCHFVRISAILRETTPGGSHPGPIIASAPVHYTCWPFAPPGCIPQLKQHEKTSVQTKNCFAHHSITHHDLARPGLSNHHQSPISFHHLSLISQGHNRRWAYQDLSLTIQKCLILRRTLRASVISRFCFLTIAL